MIPLGRLFALVQVPQEVAERAKPEHLVKPLAFAIPALIAPEGRAAELAAKLSESGAAHPLALLADLADPTIVVDERQGRTVIALRGEIVEAEVYSTPRRIPRGEYTLDEFKRVAPRGLWLEAWRLARLAGYAGDTIELYAADEAATLALLAGTALIDVIYADIRVSQAAPVAHLDTYAAKGYILNWTRGEGPHQLRLRVIHAVYTSGDAYVAAALAHTQ